MIRASYVGYEEITDDVRSFELETEDKKTIYEVWNLKYPRFEIWDDELNEFVKVDEPEAQIQEYIDDYDNGDGTFGYEFRTADGSVYAEIHDLVFDGFYDTEGEKINDKVIIDD
jgi:hypothetical protein